MKQHLSLGRLVALLSISLFIRFVRIHSVVERSRHVCVCVCVRVRRWRLMNNEFDLRADRVESRVSHWVTTLIENRTLVALLSTIVK